MNNKIPVTFAYGDGIGPEIMSSVLTILENAEANLDVEVIEIGEKLYIKGNTSGIDKSAWDSLIRTKVFLKAPITTPQGKGYKSLNVTIRKTFGLFANVRPCISYHPFIDTKFPEIDVVIVRENEEDTYAGIEYRQTQEVFQCIKLISRPGSEKIIRYAFEYAVMNHRKKVSCFVKDNIMKMTDGIFHHLFNEISKEYKEIQADSYIVDFGAAQLATSPEQFDVIVAENLYGDIISDIAAQMTGSVGLAGSMNIGEKCAMFEAVHGSAPQIAGKGIANPSGLLLASVMMLVHIKQLDVASNIHNALLKLIEEGMHTPDIFKENISKKQINTKQFTEEIIKRLGSKPEKLKQVDYAVKKTEMKDLNKTEKSNYLVLNYKKQIKELIGVDVFIDWNLGSAEALGDMLKQIRTSSLKLLLISNRGVKVWPQGFTETFCTDHWRCRFVSPGNEVIHHKEITELLNKLTESGFEFIKVENLYTFDGVPGFTLIQGQ